MKVNTRLGEVNKIGYPDSNNKPLNALNTSTNMTPYTIDPDNGISAGDRFRTSQDPVVSLFRGILKGFGLCIKWMFVGASFFVPFYLTAKVFQYFNGYGW
jgi:hypothetical protein|tara:strand:+ start:36 stop:335 length:300 start_codon:yes stop_codon:yes gene_type:complete